MSALRIDQVQNSFYKGFSTSFLFIFPAAWLTGILSLHLFHFILGSRFAFISSCCGAMLATFIVWLLVVRRIEKFIPFWPVFLFFTVKALFVYSIWTTNVFAPSGGGDLEVTQIAYFDEAYYFWEQVEKLVQWWQSSGFTLPLLPDNLAYNHPEAMALVSLPFTALPTYSEVLIPWNMFYTMAAAAAILALGRLEGFSKRTCKFAFYLLLIQPFGWYIWEPLKRDAQCQMCFAVFLLGIVHFRHRTVPLLVTTALGCFVLNFYRFIYGPIFVVSSFYVYSVTRGWTFSRKFITRIAVSIGLLVLLIVINPMGYSSNAVDYVSGLVGKYGIADVELAAERGYQSRLSRHDSSLASLPDRIALGLISPFPWTNCLDSKNAFELASSVTSYLYTALMFVCFGTIALFGWRDFKRKRYPPVSVVFALGVAASGFLGYAVHNVYVQVGMLSTFPYVIDKLGYKKLIICYILSIGIFVITSCVWYFMR